MYYQDSCSLCFVDYTEADSQNILQYECNHTNHIDCAVEWIFKHNSCPLCRRSPAVDGLDTLHKLVSTDNAKTLQILHKVKFGIYKFEEYRRLIYEVVKTKDMRLIEAVMSYLHESGKESLLLSFVRYGFADMASN